MIGDSKALTSNSKTLRFIITCVIIAILGGMVYLAWPYLSVFKNPEDIRRLIISAGAWGPLVFILMQIGQVLFAPIPGQVVVLAGGYLFGPLLGLMYTTIGATVGFTLVLFLARKLGRPFVERFVGTQALQKFDYLSKEKGPWVFFFIYLLPAFPDDVISFIAGLTTIRIRTLVLMAVVGRLPGFFLLSLTGYGLTYENYYLIIAVSIASIILFAAAWWKRDWMREFAEHENRLSFLMLHWKTSMEAIGLWLRNLERSSL